MPRHVLIVEDHPDLRVTLVRLVAHVCTDVTIATAADGADALDAVAQHRPDLIVSDYRMPGVNGLQLVRALRAQGLPMPIIMLSSDPSAEAASLTAGANAFLLKPFRLADFDQILHALLPNQAEWGAA
jgi:CheY-like chemotaxis protein